MRCLRNEQEIITAWKGDPSKPRVSVCCITYNHELYIEDALEGFLIQETDFPFEVLVHDDASTDRTADIIREYEAEYPNIIKPIYQIENQYSQGKKPGEINLARSKGRYIALCEGDDYWTDPLKLKIQVDFLENHPDYVITYHWAVTFNQDGSPAKQVDASKKDLSQEQLKKTPSIHTLTVCFRNCIKSYPPETCFARVGDLFLWSLLGQFGKGKYMGNIKPAYYRVHDTGVFSKKSVGIKLDMKMSTNIALYFYYKRINDIEIAKFFAERALFQLIWVIGIKRAISINLKKYLYKFLKKTGLVSTI